MFSCVGLSARGRLGCLALTLPSAAALLAGTSRANPDPKDVRLLAVDVGPDLVGSVYRIQCPRRPSGPNAFYAAVLSCRQLSWISTRTSPLLELCKDLPIRQLCLGEVMLQVLWRGLTSRPQPSKLVVNL